MASIAKNIIPHRVGGILLFTINPPITSTFYPALASALASITYLCPMADFNLIMPKMGESIMEATILRWLKKPGDMVALDETILEIATDKVDSEIPSPVAGKLEKILFDENAVVPVGQTIAVIST